MEQLPLVLVVTNNQFAYSTPNVREFGGASLADRGRGYGFAVHEVDGTDFMALLETFWKAVGAARNGEGPQWVLAKTLRMCGHGEHDDASYIPKELKEETAVCGRSAACRSHGTAGTGAGPLPGRLERHCLETLLRPQTEHSHERNIH